MTGASGPAPSCSPGKLGLVFGSAIFLGAFLLFLVQPLLGKCLTPAFGGVASVWLTCLAFFQSALLCGYAYAHLLQRLSPRAQGRAHAGALLAALAWLGAAALEWGTPLLPPAAAQGVSGDPALRIAVLLGSAVGLPFVLLSATTPLYQAWWTRVAPGSSPFPFYALSNAGSLLALAAYPLAVEPLMPLSAQAWAWAAGFALFLGFTLAAALMVRGAPGQAAAAPQPAEGPPGDLGGARWDFWLWTALSALGSLCLMATTQELTQDVAPMPFLWAVPLAVYLLTFILSFGRRPRWLGFDALALLLVFGTGLAVYVQYSLVERLLGLGLLVAGFAAAQFAACLFCHAALYSARPASSGLTRFYLAIALGGTLGGLFSTLAAPRFFDSYWEYPLSFVGVLVLATALLSRRAESRLHEFRHAGWILSLGTAALFASVMSPSSSGRTLEQARNFYGVLRVVERPGGGGAMIRSLRNGFINHGGQFDSGPRRLEPGSYFGRQSGIGLLLESARKRAGNRPIRVGVVGLGVGVLSAYGRSGDVFRFYEINPEVVRLATRSPWFSYVKDSPARVEVSLQDGRLGLESELRQGARRSYDVLVLDAFNGDAIPTHLLTREAFETYLALIRPDGALAVQASNRYVNLVPLMVSVASHFGLSCRGVLGAAEPPLTMPSRWVLLAPEGSALSAAPADGRSSRDLNLAMVHPAPLWTDDYSDPFGLLLK